jgi:hypothetical protein
MNAHRSSRSRRLARCTFLIVIASFLLATGQSTATAQNASTQILADQYFGAMVGTAALASTFTMVAPDAMLHTPEGQFRGPEGTSQFASTLNASFSNLTFAPQWSEVEEDLVVVRFTMIGSHTGEYLDRAPLCAKISVPGMAVLRMDGSGIADQWITYDKEKVLTQIDRFAQIDPAERPGCIDRSGDTTRSPFEGPPTCGIHRSCPNGF